ncbi:MAG: phosphatidylserine decarboxylase family protein [Crocinitomicaceae bacterium]
MKIHREGYLIIAIAFIILAVLEVGNYLLFELIGWKWLLILIWLIGLTLFTLIVQFFRIPKRSFTADENDIICPADGKVVVIEEVEETEYFKDKRIQVSVFMSPLNVHANYNPIAGIIKYVKYHKGLFLVAWHPKSSTDNERSTVVTQHKSGKEVLFRQIAGAVARRICYYIQENQDVQAGEEYGFIKFGSRIDLFLPLDSTINVKIGDVVKGKVTKIGKLN